MADIQTPEVRKPEVATPEEESLEGPFFHPNATELGKQAVLAFRRDLPELMKTHPGQWVAYHGDKRLKIARDGQALYRECIRLGIPSADYIVGRIGPQGPDVVDLD